MTLRLGVTSDADLAPLYFPIEAGWAALPEGITTISGSLSDLEGALLKGEMDVAPINPLTYALHTDRLRLLPTPVRTSDLGSDAVFLISLRRLDQVDKAKVAISPNSPLGEAILKIIATKYYGFVPETSPVASEAAALDALQGQSQMCVISGEAAMRAVGWAKSKGYQVEDLTKAWWIMSGLPLPTQLMAVNKSWTEKEPEATASIRALMLAFRRSLQHSQEQRPTLLERMVDRTGLPLEALDNHYRAQRYDFNEGQLRGLLEFYRRAAAIRLLPPLDDLSFFPALAALAPAPAAPPRRVQPEPTRPRPVPQPTANRPRLRPVTETEEETVATPPPSKKPGSRRTEAEAKGLRVIKGGKNQDKPSDRDEEAPED